MLGQSFLRLGLVDEIRLSIIPVLLGDGLRLFDNSGTEVRWPRKLRREMGGNIMSRNGGIVGVSDHGGWAVLVTVARDGTLLDRRRVELVDEDLPALPHHHEGQGLPLGCAQP